jgi:hypothetical protein
MIGLLGRLLSGLGIPVAILGLLIVVIVNGHEVSGDNMRIGWGMLIGGGTAAAIGVGLWLWRDLGRRRG